jgi:hypothetical protein
LTRPGSRKTRKVGLIKDTEVLKEEKTKKGQNPKPEH